MRMILIYRWYVVANWPQLGDMRTPLGRYFFVTCISGIERIEMKRNNPTTNAPFRRGDIRHDGYIFFAYTNKLKLDGYFKEIWLSPTASQQATVNDRLRKRKTRNGIDVRHTGTYG